MSMMYGNYEQYTNADCPLKAIKTSYFDIAISIFEENSVKLTMYESGIIVTVDSRISSSRHPSLRPMQNMTRHAPRAANTGC